MKLAELLHFCLTAKSSGIIHCKTSSGSGSICIKNGEIIAAHYGDLQGEASFFSMILCQDAECEFSEEPVSETPSITKSTHYLLMEAARRSDTNTSEALSKAQSDHKPKAADFCLNFITMDHAKFSLQGDTVIIGRDSGCDITVPDVSVSARHCRIIWNGRDHMIDDLESFNGTYLNEAVVSQNATPLHPGDNIQVGLCHFRYERLQVDDTLTDPKSAVPFTFGSETQKIQIPVKHQPESSKVGSSKQFKEFKPVESSPKKNHLWPFGSKS